MTTHRCIAAALKRRTVVRVVRHGERITATITAVHNSDPVPGLIRWETAEHGDISVGGAAVVDVVAFPIR